MYGSEQVDALIDEIEEEYCLCGAGLDREVPKIWEHCGIHRRCKQLRQAVCNSMPIT